MNFIQFTNNKHIFNEQCINVLKKKIQKKMMLLYIINSLKYFVTKDANLIIGNMLSRNKIKLDQYLSNGTEAIVFNCVTKSKCGRVLKFYKSKPEDYKVYNLLKMNHRNVEKYYSFSTLKFNGSSIKYSINEKLQDIPDDTVSSNNIELIFKDIHCALKYIHSRKMLHGDIHSGNIMCNIKHNNNIDYKLIDLTFHEEENNFNTYEFVCAFEIMPLNLFNDSNKWSYEIDYIQLLNTLYKFVNNEIFWNGFKESETDKIGNYKYALENFASNKNRHVENVTQRSVVESNVIIYDIPFDEEINSKMDTTDNAIADTYAYSSKSTCKYDSGGADDDDDDVIDGDDGDGDEYTRPLVVVESEDDNCVDYSNATTVNVDKKVNVLKKKLMNRFIFDLLEYLNNNYITNVTDLNNFYKIVDSNLENLAK